MRRQLLQKDIPQVIDYIKANIEALGGLKQHEIETKVNNDLGLNISASSLLKYLDMYGVKRRKHAPKQKANVKTSPFKPIPDSMDKGRNSNILAIHSYAIMDLYGKLGFAPPEFLKMTSQKRSSDETVAVYNEFVKMQQLELFEELS